MKLWPLADRRCIPKPSHEPAVPAGTTQNAEKPQDTRRAGTAIFEKWLFGYRQQLDELREQPGIKEVDSPTSK